MWKKLILMLSVCVVASSAFAAKSKAPAKAAGGAVAVKEITLNGSDGKDIVAVAAGSADHTTLVTAIKAVPNLLETLSGPGPYTIFAPTNAAFDKLPKGTVESLLKKENVGKLESILQHHAAAPAYHLDVLQTMSEVDMVDGPKLKVTKKDGKLFVNDVEIKAAIRTLNGVIYVVDTVLL